jgi:hypothetical protein
LVSSTITMHLLPKNGSASSSPFSCSS